MKKLALLGIGTIILAGGLTVGFGAQKPAIFAGEVMDSRCAQAGSHDKMIESNHAKNADDCTIACVKSGALFVLFDSTNKMVYQLDNQKRPKDFAGLKVKVTGTLDKATMTIHVKSIDTLPSVGPGSSW